MNTEQPQSVISKLSLLQVHHKQINSLLNVYQQRVAHPVPPLKRKKINASETLPKLPKATINKLQADSSTSVSTLHPKPFSTSKTLTDNNNVISRKETTIPLIHEEKIKLQKLKESIQLNRENKRKAAKEMKESNRLMRENVLLFRENLFQENLQKKKIVDARYKLIHSSISNYKELKKDYITSIYQQQIERQIKQISEKAIQLDNLRTSYESKMLCFTPNKSSQIMDISEKDEVSSHPSPNNYEKLLSKRDETNTFMTGLDKLED